MNTLYLGKNKIGVNTNANELPIGTILPFSANKIPQGYLLCNGNEYNKKDYSDLYATIGDTYNKPTTTQGYFCVPDFRGRFLQGVSDGETLGSKKEAGLPNITGSTKWLSADTVWNNTTDGAFLGYSADGPNIVNVEKNGNSFGHRFKFDASNSNSIYGNSTTVQPPAVTINYIIKATNFFDLPQNAIDDTKTTTGNTWSAEKIIEYVNSKI